MSQRTTYRCELGVDRDSRLIVVLLHIDHQAHICAVVPWGAGALCSDHDAAFGSAREIADLLHRRVNAAIADNDPATPPAQA